MLCKYLKLKKWILHPPFLVTYYIYQVTLTTDSHMNVHATEVFAFPVTFQFLDSVGHIGSLIVSQFIDSFYFITF